ncbi:MAG: hypothetical protein ACJ8OJ_17880, partial [Povalibacter sp.]
MQRRQPDPTLSAVHSVGSLDADPVDVVVLSSDEGLISTLQEAAGTANVIWHAPSEDAAVDLLVGGRCGIFIADLAVVRTDASALLEKLQAQFPELVLLGAGRREDEGAVARLISKGHVYRFLHKPVSPARANLFLATATRRYRELVPGISPAMATVRHFTQPSNRGTLLLGIGVVAALALVGVGMLMMRPSTHDIAPTAVEPVASANAPATATTSPADEI